MLKVNQNLGVSGEFQVIVRRADGSIKFDSGMQPNLILDNGIKTYLGLAQTNNYGKVESHHRNNMMANCIVGTGNTQPIKDDIALANFIATNVSTRDETNGKVEPTGTSHPGFVRMWKQKKFIFEGIVNQNLAEVGLCAWRGDAHIDNVYRTDVYVLVTRALIKDTGGSPITVTVLEGEVLEIIYRLNMYVDIKRQTGTFTLTTSKDGQDTTDTFAYFLQPYEIASGSGIDVWISPDTYSHSLLTWGVKETDDELTADYDLNDVDYQSITHTNTSNFAGKIQGSHSTSTSHADKYHERYQTWDVYERDVVTGRQSTRFTNGIYSHIHPNGIRAFSFPLSSSYTLAVGRALVVLKNQANGQGIKKTNRQLWEVEVGYTISRWEE